MRRWMIGAFCVLVFVFALFVSTTQTAERAVETVLVVSAAEPVDTTGDNLPPPALRSMESTIWSQLIERSNTRRHTVLESMLYVQEVEHTLKYPFCTYQLDTTDGVYDDTQAKSPEGEDRTI